MRFSWVKFRHAFPLSLLPPFHDNVATIIFIFFRTSGRVFQPDFALPNAELATVELFQGRQIRFICLSYLTKRLPPVRFL